MIADRRYDVTVSKCLRHTIVGVFYLPAIRTFTCDLLTESISLEEMIDSYPEEEESSGSCFIYIVFIT